MGVKIRTFFQRAYTRFSEDITIIGDLFHSAIFHLHALLVILLAFAGWRLSKRDAHHGRAPQGAGYARLESGRKRWQISRRA